MNDQAHQLRQIVGRIKEKRLRQERQTRIITVTSGKGGVGKTTFTVNLALALRKKGYRVLIIDGDFGLANVNIVMGASAKYDLSHVFREEKELSEIITEGPGGVMFISGGSGLSDLFEPDNIALDKCLKQLMKLGDMSDIILVDTGAGISERVIRLILSGREVILITTPEPTAIMDAYALTKTVLNIDKDIHFQAVVNMAEADEGESALTGFAALVKRYLGKEIDALGCISPDPSVPEAIKLQTPVYLSFPDGKAARGIERIASKLVCRTPEADNNMRRFLQRLACKISI